MNRDDLLNMLDLAGTDAPPDEEPLGITAADGTKPKAANPTVFRAR